MGVATLLAAIRTPRFDYKSPADVGTPVGAEPGTEKDGDIVIIGGGSAGCVLASRISERSDLRVLLLEAGGSGSALLLSRVPATFPLLFHTTHDWNLYTVPQKNANNRMWYWPRGKMLGGCSSINAEIFHYGAPEDFAEWVGDSKDPGAQQWSYENFHPYYLKWEKFAPHGDYATTDVTQRGTAGKIETGFGGQHSSWPKSFTAGCAEIGIPTSPDLNTPSGSLGATDLMTYIGTNGERSTSETAYLTKDVLKRPNLTVVTGAHVTKIVFETTKSGEKRASAVEFVDRHSRTPKHYRVRVNKEVVLSAGAVHSPQILMLSGIGPAAHLAEHNIPVELDLPGVGQNLKDHPIVETMWRLNSGSLEFIRPETGFMNSLRALGSLLRWLFTRTGMMLSNVTEAAAFIRSDDPVVFPKDQYPNTIEDSTSGPGAPDLEIICTPVGLKRHGDEPTPGGQIGSMAAVLLRPTSSGTIQLKSNSPFDDPVIDPHYFDTQHDIDVLVRGMRAMFSLAHSSSMSAQINPHETNPEFDQELEKLTDKELENVIRHRSETLYHPTSTVRMAPLSDNGCVDFYLRVHGIPNLRVVDDSILPNIISGHTAGPAFALGEKASELIKDAYPAPAA